MTHLHVICQIAGSEYAISAADVYQMESFTGATPVPGAPAYVAGLVQVRQQIIPVLDLRRRFGLPPSPPTPESRVIVLKLKDRLVGLLVDSAREVQNFNADQFHATPDVIQNQTTGFVKSIVQLKNRMIMLLDSEKVVGERSAHV